MAGKRQRRTEANQATTPDTDQAGSGKRSILSEILEHPLNDDPHGAAVEAIARWQSLEHELSAPRADWMDADTQHEIDVLSAAALATFDRQMLGLRTLARHAAVQTSLAQANNLQAVAFAGWHGESFWEIACGELRTRWHRVLRVVQPTLAAHRAIEVFGEPPPLNVQPARLNARRPALAAVMAELPQVDWQALVTQLHCERRRCQPQAAEYLGDGRVAIGNQVVTLDGVQGMVLESLVELRSAKKRELEERSGVPDAIKALNAIVAAIPDLKPFIKLPGGKGKGGYSTTIVDGRG